MTRQQEHARIAELRLSPNATVRIVFRNSESDLTLPSEWDCWEGEVQERVVLAEGQQAWRVEYNRGTEGVYVGYLPVGMGYDLAEVSVVKKAPPRAVMGTPSTVSGKRDRDDSAFVPPGLAGQQTSLGVHAVQMTPLALHDITAALEQNKLNKQTVLVQNGDSLKVPAQNPGEFWPAYPNQWFARRTLHSAEKVADDLWTAWNALASYLGASLKTDDVRGAFRQGIMHAQDAVHNPSFPPNRLRWRALFWTSFQLLQLIVSNTHGATAGASLMATLSTMFDEKSFVDIEAAVRQVEKEVQSAKGAAPANTAPTTPAVQHLAQQIATSFRQQLAASQPANQPTNQPVRRRR